MCYRLHSDKHLALDRVHSRLCDDSPQPMSIVKEFVALVRAVRHIEGGLLVLQMRRFMLK